LFLHIVGAKLDLERAIFLSHGHGKAARQAFTQRAMIRRLEGNATSLLGSDNHMSLENVCD